MTLVLGPFGRNGSASAEDGAASTVGSCSRVPTIESALIRGRLTACGNALVDAMGHRVRLRAYRFNGFLPGNGDAQTCSHWYPPPSSMAQALRTQGFNSVFLMLSWANLEPTRPTRRPDGSVVHHWNLGYLRALDSAIKGFAAHGIAVVLDLAQWKWSPAFTNLDVGGSIVNCGAGMPIWLYPHGGGIRQMAQAERRFYGKATTIRSWYLNASKLIARRYAKWSSVVGFVLCWEAYDLIAKPYLGYRLAPQALHLTRWYEAMGRAIRTFEPRQLLIAPDWQSHDGRQFALVERPRLPNLMSTFEYYAYAWNQDARTRLAGYVRRAHDWNAPSWISEFNAFGHATTPPGTSPDPNWASDTAGLLRYAKSVRLSWSIFGSVDARLAKILRRWGA